jgi:hypothetical protein
MKVDIRNSECFMAKNRREQGAKSKKQSYSYQIYFSYETINWIKYYSGKINLNEWCFKEKSLMGNSETLDWVVA